MSSNHLEISLVVKVEGFCSDCICRAKKVVWIFMGVALRNS